MFTMRFTERPYVAYTEADVKSSFRSSVRLTFSNAHFDPAVGARVYDEAFAENQFAEEAGFDGIMLNEHHNTPTCMGATMNLEAAVLARSPARRRSCCWEIPCRFWTTRCGWPRSWPRST